MIKVQNEVQNIEDEQVQEQYQQQYDMIKIQINDVTDTIKIKVKGDISEEDQALIDSIVTELESVEEYEVELKEIGKAKGQDNDEEECECEDDSECVEDECEEECECDSEELEDESEDDDGPGNSQGNNPN